VYDGTTWHNLVTDDTATNQIITLTGDATGSGTSTITVTLQPPPGFVSAGTFEKITFDSKGRVIKGVNLNSADITTAIGSLLTVNGGITASAAITGQNVSIKSGGGGVLAFADGTTQNTAARVKYLGQLNLYVDPINGNDSNSGITPSTPVKTIQAATSIVVNNYDLQGGTANVYCRDGVYTAGAYVWTNLYNGNIHYIGNIGSPLNCRVSLPAGGSCFTIVQGATVYISGFALEAPNGSQGQLWTAPGTALSVGTAGRLYFDHVAFGPCSWAHISSGAGGYVSVPSQGTPYSIYGNAIYHLITGSGGAYISIASAAVNVTTNVTFSTFAWADASSLIVAPAISVNLNGHTVSGQRYVVSNGGYVYVGGSGINTFPGTIPGNNISGYYG
jgi:hypothetical protein